MRLQQKNVIAVEMRAHTAAIGGIAHHHIVQTRVGHEAKLVHQRVDALVEQIGKDVGQVKQALLAAGK